MKKSLLCSIVLAAMLGTNAYAATVGYEDGTVTPSDVTEEVKTVLITKTPEEGSSITDDDIYYINQAAKGSVLDAATGFVMKSGAPDGMYTLTLGYSAVTDLSASSEAIEFEISSLPADVDMEALADAVSENADGSFNMGFVAEGIALGDYKWLVLTFGTGEDAVTMGYPVEKLGTTVSGGLVNLGIQVNNIPDEYEGAVKLGFTAKDNNAGGNE